jgi:hydrogenase nickel incorporation protein HypA/HybF
MHEASLMHDLVHMIETVVAQASARRATRVEVRLGALTQMSAEHFREHFAMAVRGTVAEGAALEIAVADNPADPDADSVSLCVVEVDD